jgi:hypothetical protein
MTGAFLATPGPIHVPVNSLKEEKALASAEAMGLSRVSLRDNDSGWIA